MEVYLRRVGRRLVMLGMAGAIMGLYLGITDGFEKVSSTLSIGGIALAVTGGIMLFLARDPS